MKLNFKRVASVLASAVMLSSTIGMAAASSYPQPFVSSGTADSAVVVGASAAVSDWSAAIDLQQNLNKLVSSGSSSSGSSVSGEAAALFTSGSKIYINDSLNNVKSILTKSDLPTVLSDSSFSGNVDATISQTIALGSYPRITFAKQPTSSDDPNYALTTSTSRGNYIYNASATFSKAVNFTHADTKGEDITLFGQSFTVASSTDATNLVLLKSAEKVSLDSDSPTAEVTVGGKSYTVELVSASDSAATIKVTDSSGNSESKEIAEAASKKVAGITIAVINADETNLKLSASIIAGAEKMTLSDGNEITTGDEGTSIDGAYAFFTGGTTAMTKLTVSVVASESDKDAIKAGDAFTDPVFGTFKLDFSGFNVAQDTTDNSARETIKVTTSGDDKLQITMTDNAGNEKSLMFAKNTTTAFGLYADDDNRNFTVMEGQALHYQDYVVVGNELEGHLLKVSAATNQSSGWSNDKAEFKDVFTGDTLTTTWTNDGVGTVVIGGKSYDVTMSGASGSATESYTIRLNYPDSTGNGAVIYPTIQTSKGAKLAFYQPQTITLNAYDGTNALTTLRFPDGDGYTDITGIVANGTANGWNFTAGGSLKTLDTSGTGLSFTVTVGKLTYNVTTIGSANKVKVMLVSPSGGNIDKPGIVVFEGKDDNSDYQALVFDLKNGRVSNDAVGVNNVIDTWSGGSSSWRSSMPGDSNLQEAADLWGSIITLDSSDSNHKIASISYPSEQMNAQLFVAETSAAITPGTVSGGNGGQILIVKDSEVASVSTKNLIVVGGSCINAAAAKILGSESPMCGADFTTKTGVGAGQYIIKTVTSPYAAEGSSKIAMLVAGFNAEDTVNAVAKAMEGAKSDKDSSQVYPITATATGA